MYTYLSCLNWRVRVGSVGGATVIEHAFDSLQLELYKTVGRKLIENTSSLDTNKKNIGLQLLCGFDNHGCLMPEAIIVIIQYFDYLPVDVNLHCYKHSIVVTFIHIHILVVWQ